MKRIIFCESSTLDDLLNNLDHFGGLWGSDGDYYSSQRLRFLLLQVKDRGPGSLVKIPRGLGLRAKAQELFFPEISSQDAPLRGKTRQV